MKDSNNLDYSETFASGTLFCKIGVSLKIYSKTNIWYRKRVSMSIPKLVEILNKNH